MATTTGPPIQQSDINKVLQQLRLNHHENAFQENGIATIADMKLLSAEDIREIGVTILGERNRLKKWIADHREEIAEAIVVHQEENLKATINAKVLDEPSLTMYRTLFAFFDADNNGTIALGEFAASLKFLQVSENDVEISRLFQEADRDHSGAIDFDEFVEVMQRSHTHDPSMARLVGTLKVIKSVSVDSGIDLTEYFNADLVEGEMTKLTKSLSDYADNIVYTVPIHDDCTSVACHCVFNFVYGHDKLVELAARAMVREWWKTCTEELVGLDASEEQVVQDTMRTFICIVHQYCHINRRDAGRKELINVRFAAFVLASNRSVSRAARPKQEEPQVSHVAVPNAHPIPQVSHVAVSNAHPIHQVSHVAVPNARPIRQAMAAEIGKQIGKQAVLAIFSVLFSS